MTLKEQKETVNSLALDNPQRQQEERILSEMEWELEIEDPTKKAIIHQEGINQEIKQGGTISGKKTFFYKRRA